MTRNLLFITFLLFVFACEKTEVSFEEIDFSNSIQQFEIVVEGGITTIEGKQWVRLSTLSSFDNRLKYMPVTDAVLTIICQQDTFRMQHDSIQGEYSTIDKVKGEIGKVYTLQINYNSKIYIATDSLVASLLVNEYMPATSIENYGEIVSVTIKEHTFGFEQTSVRNYNQPDFDSLGNQFYINISNKQLIISNLSEEPFFYFQHKGSPPQGVFPYDWENRGISGRDTDTIEVISMSVSKGYADFLSSLFSETEWVGSAFASPPGNVKTNVTNGGIGFFQATHVTKTYIKLGDMKMIE